MEIKDQQVIAGRKPISQIREDVGKEFGWVEDPVRKAYEISKETFGRLYPDQITIEFVTNMLHDYLNYYKKESIVDVVSYLKGESEYFSDRANQDLGEDKPSRFFGALGIGMGIEGRKQELRHLAQNYETAARLFENNKKINFTVVE